MREQRRVDEETATMSEESALLKAFLCNRAAAAASGKESKEKPMWLINRSHVNHRLTFTRSHSDTLAHSISTNIKIISSITIIIIIIIIIIVAES